MTVALAEALAALGARLEDGGDRAIAHYGDPVAEHRAAREATGLQWRPWRAPFRVRGRDRLTFLQRILSNDIHAVGPGGGQRSLLLTPKGKVIGDLDLWLGDEEVLGATAASAADEVTSTLRGLVLRADVVIDDLREDRVTLGLVGPGADALLASLGGRPPRETYAHEALTAAGAALAVMRTPQLAAPGAELVACAEDAVAVVDALAGETRASGGSLIGRDVAEILRVEAGIPGHGTEITGGELPQELRLDGCIDWDKGCYVGQEPVARLHYRGHVNRLLYGLTLGAGARPGWEIRAEGRVAGLVTSVVESPAHGMIGLGIVRCATVDDGTRLTAGPVGGDGAGAVPVEVRDFVDPETADGGSGA